jgi:hypothetical protein
MLDWFRRFKAGWDFANAAAKKQEIEKSEVSTKTKIAGLAIVDGIRNRKPVCRRCFAIFVPKEYEFAERFQVRANLHIADSAPDPMFCDFCFQSVLAEKNHKWTNVGTSNAGPTNLALRRLIAKD